jgi:hypothetical protein
MGYLINIEIDEYEFQFGEMGYPVQGKGIWINFDDEKIKNSIECDDPYLLQAIVKAFEQHEEIDALYTMTNFEHYHLQGHGWNTLTHNYNFSSLELFKKKSFIVLNSNMANPEQIRVAQTIIDVLNGDYQAPPKPEKSIEEKEKNRFENKKASLRLKLTIEHGYKCDNCAKCDEGSLCVIRKDESVVNYEIENLVLRCRSCINKMRSKK